MQRVTIYSLVAWRQIINSTLAKAVVDRGVGNVAKSIVAYIMILNLA
jgi:hypothetical protein